MRPNPAMATRVMTQPGIWEHMGSGDPADFAPHKAVVWLADDEGNACFPCHKVRDHMWELHAAVLPEARRYSRYYAKEAIAWIHGNTDCRLLTAVIKSDNAPAIALARLVGMRLLTRLPSALKSGDAVLYGMELGQWAA